MAILAATQAVPKNEAILIKSDSQITLNSITKYLRKQEDERWIGTANKNIMESLVA